MANRTSFSDAERALLEAPNFATVSTLRADGTILNVPVWVSVDGDEVVLNSETKRTWPQNLRERKVVTVTVTNRENPYEYVSISGHLASETTDGAFEDADVLAKQYMNVDKYPLHKDGDVRVLLRIAPERITYSG